MPEELLRLARDLAALHTNFPKTGTVTFSPTEPNVELTFGIRPTGVVVGTYQLRAELSDGPKLTGEFVADQSYLPDIASSLQRFVRAVTGAA